MTLPTWWCSRCGAHYDRPETAEALCPGWDNGCPAYDEAGTEWWRDERKEKAE